MRTIISRHATPPITPPTIAVVRLEVVCESEEVSEEADPAVELPVVTF
jgi:hypothetical protein